MEADKSISAIYNTKRHSPRFEQAANSPQMSQFQEKRNERNMICREFQQAMGYKSALVRGSMQKPSHRFAEAENSIRM
jgi:hypothetical protein